LSTIRFPSIDGNGTTNREELEVLWVNSTHLEEAQVGTRVRVQVDYTDPQRRGAVGTIKERYGVAEYMAYEVLFPDGQTELYWDHQLKEAKEESAFRTNLRRLFWEHHGG
jgi:hypothetical protein